MFTKKSLAVFLSKLKVFDKPNISLEQYPTDSQVAAEVLWAAHMNDEITGKTIADFGCGTGILGIGAILLGAKKIYFVDIDKAALEILKENLAFVEDNYEFGAEYEIENTNIINFKNKIDLVIQNPPFGTRNEHADKVFLEKAFNTADLIYSFHKTSTEKFVRAISKDHKFLVAAEYKLSFPLKKTFAHHQHRIERIDVSCFRLKKN